MLKEKFFVAVDGDNIGRTSMLLYQNGFGNDAIRRFYIGKNIGRDVYKTYFLDFEVVRVQKNLSIGKSKELVDREIERDMFMYYLNNGIKKFVICSNDYDFGEMAVKFKERCKKAKITIMSELTKVDKNYSKELKKLNISFKPFSKPNVEDLHFQISNLVREHISGNKISLSKIAEIFNEYGFPYKKGCLKQDLEYLGLKINEDNHLEISSPEF